VAVAEDRRLHANLVADTGLDRVAATVDERRDVLDLDAGGHALLRVSFDPTRTVNSAPWS